MDMHIDRCEEKTDTELVFLALQNQEHYLCLMRRYEEKLLRYITRISGFSRDVAEDVLQSTFIKVYQNLNNFNDSLKFSSWIYRIAHNQAISYYRSAKIRPEPLGVDREILAEKLSSDLDIEEELDKKLLATHVEDILNQMDKKYREVLVLKFLEGYDYNEISDILEKPMGTVGTLINRAKKSFKEEYLKLGKTF